MKYLLQCKQNIINEYKRNILGKWYRSVYKNIFIIRFISKIKINKN